METKVLLALTAAVLLAHIAVLRASAVTAGGQPLLARAFTTRTIELIPTRLPAAEQALTRPASSRPEDPPVRAAPARAARAQPAQGLAESVTTLQPAAAVIDQEANSSPPAQAEPQAEPDARADQSLPAPRAPRDATAALNVDKLPGSVRLKYQVEANKLPFRLNAELQWQQDGASYEARLEFRAFGQGRTQTSRGEVTAQGLAPVRFSDKYRSEVAAHFNREQGKVTFSANTPEVPLLAGAQDRLSILVQLATIIASAPDHYTQASTIAIQTISARDADTWLFTVGSAETLSLPGGEQVTLKLVRNPRQAFDQKVELWLAPALGYLPARIRITETNGDYIEQKWLATDAPN